MKDAESVSSTDKAMSPQTQLWGSQDELFLVSGKRSLWVYTGYSQGLERDVSPFTPWEIAREQNFHLPKMLIRMLTA